MFNSLPPEKKDKIKFALGVLVILFIFLDMALININAPFDHVTADSNGFFGLAAENLAQKGIWQMKFGMYPDLIRPGDILPGHYYIDHPDAFIFPTVFLYKFFGVSEATTRLGPILEMLLALGLFAYALRKIFRDDFKAWLSTLILAILPGFIFYGETMEISSAALAAAIAGFSLFVLCFPEQKKANLIFFYLSIFIGCLFGWFFYFMALLLWFYLLFSKMPAKLKPLIIIPILVLAAAAVTVAHFFWLNGNVVGDLIGAAAFRTQGVPWHAWLVKISSMLVLHANFIFLILAVDGMIIFFLRWRKNSAWHIFLPLLIFPFLICASFRQWVTHPFGVIYFLPIIAVFAGIGLFALSHLLRLVFTRFGRPIAIAAVSAIMLAGAFFSYTNLEYFFNGFLILNKGDIDLFRNLSQAKDLQDYNVCLGSNNLHINITPIVEWYLGKKVSCEFPDKIKVVLAYNLSSDKIMGGKYYANEWQYFENLGYKPGGCSGFLCSLIKAE